MLGNHLLDYGFLLWPCDEITIFCFVFRIANYVEFTIDFLQFGKRVAAAITFFDKQQAAVVQCQWYRFTTFNEGHFFSIEMEG